MIKLKTIVLVHLSETSHMLRLNKLLQSDLKYSVRFRLSSIYLQGVKMLVILVLTLALTWFPLHMMMIAEDMDPAIFKTINRNMLWIAGLLTITVYPFFS
jgi:hypothetical protein